MPKPQQFRHIATRALHGHGRWLAYDPVRDVVYVMKMSSDLYK